MVPVTIKVYGEGLKVCDWLYVMNRFKEIVLIIHECKVSGICNIGGHSEKQNAEIMRIICNEFAKLEILITYIENCKGHGMCYVIGPTKIHNELEWLS